MSGLFVALALFLVSASAYLFWLQATDRVFPNVTVGPVAAGGLTRPALEAALAARLALSGVTASGEMGSAPIVFADSATGRTWSVAPDELGVRVDVTSTIDAALASGPGSDEREGLSHYLAGLAGLLVCSTQGRPVPLAVSLIEDRLASFLGPVAASVNVVPANVSLDPRTGEVRPGRAGRILDLAATSWTARETVAAGLAGAASGPPAGGWLVPLRFTAVAPRGDEDRLAALDRDRLGSFTTAFDSSQAGRTWNITLAAARLDGTVVEPGGVASFNDLVGERTPEAGFREAPEIVDNELVPGIGGGVCQVATTLYNAALLSDLEVAERYHHSRPLSYVGLGRDATVSYPGLDLVIRNPRAFPVILTAWVRDGRITVSFWGRRTVESEIRLWTEELNLQPPECAVEVRPELAAGTSRIEKEPFAGRDVRLWRDVLQDGRLVRRELIWTDHYEPLPGLVVVGPSADQGREAGTEAAGADTGDEGEGRRPRGPR